MKKNIDYCIKKLSFISVMFMGLISVWLLLEFQFGQRVDVVKNDSIVGSYLVNPDSKTPIKVNTSRFVGDGYIKIKSVSESRKVVESTTIPLLSMLTSGEVSEVESIKVKSLPDDFYYISDINTVFNKDGSVSNKISLDKLPPKTLNKFGLKPTKTVLYTNPVGFTKKGDVVLLSKDNKLITPTEKIKEEESVYKVPKNTFYTYNRKAIISMSSLEVFLVICAAFMLVFFLAT